MTHFPLRVPDDILEQARAAADEERVTLNQLMLSFIAEGLGQRKSLKMMRARARRADPESALAILDRIEGMPPERGDEMPR
jgi:hypothetical protein